MATLSTAWNISASALSAEQSALATVSNNTANATTPGYTEESAIWVQANSVSAGNTNIGQGVIDTGAVSQRDLVLNKTIDLQVQEQSASQARLGALQSLEATFSAATSVTGSSTSAASGSGIPGALSSFYGSLQQLESSPSDSSVRASVLASANTLASAFNAASSSLNGQQKGLGSDVQAILTTANGLLASLATLNVQIQSQDPNQDAGQLEDQRQQDLASLSQLIGVQQTSTEKNGISLSTVNGDPLLENGTATMLSIGESNGVAHVYSGSTDITQSIFSGGGQAGGLLQVANQDIPAALYSIDTLAFQVGSQFNTVNQDGTDLNGNPGTALFTLPVSASGSAGSIAVSTADPSLIAAAQIGGGPANDTNAVAMTNLANQPSIAGQSPASYFAEFVASLGSTVAAADATNGAQQASIAQLTNQQTTLSGVNLNTEATALENLQQAYQAASKVFTIIDQLVASAINLGTETTVT